MLSTTKKPSKGKQKITMDYIESKTKRQVSFYKRRKGLFKKAEELNSLTRSEILVIVIGENGQISDYASDNLKILIEETKEKVRQLLQLKKLENELEQHLEGDAGESQRQFPTQSPTENTDYQFQFDSIFQYGNQSEEPPDLSKPSRSY